MLYFDVKTKATQLYIKKDPGTRQGLEMFVNVRGVRQSLGLGGIYSRK